MLQKFLLAYLMYKWHGIFFDLPQLLCTFTYASLLLCESIFNINCSADQIHLCENEHLNLMVSE